MTVQSAGLAATVTDHASAGRRWLPLIVVVVIVAGLVIGASSLVPGFATIANARAILSSMTLIGIVAVGMSFVTLSGNIISTSLGTTVVISSMVFLSALTYGVPGGIVVTLIVATVVCAMQGAIIGAFGANPIVVTIAFGILQLGVAQWLTGQSTVYPPSGVDFDFLTATPLGLPVATFVLVVLVVAAELWSRRTRLGRELVLVGANRRAARAGGLRVTVVATTAFAWAGACAGIAGVFLGAAQRNATLLTSETFTWDAIAAVLLGGMAIAGGAGAIYRSVAGALVIAVISNILLLAALSTGVQLLVRGIVVFLAIVCLHVWRRWLR
ncbi:ABC transporter permease [Microbacterium sp. BR1]|uniref:ABC transporter permease n=1 Tax=Microbacterium sp. BR1 TaxID=1070896 RepID=UPI000C2C7D9D|nr:hypothetical protein [Microbacterium sp. BR1]